jgi:adenine specific DNA methylase Mod
MQPDIIEFLLTTDFDTTKNKMIDRFFTISHYSQFPFKTDDEAIECADVVFKNGNFFELYRFKADGVKTSESLTPLCKGELGDDDIAKINKLIAEKNFQDATLLLLLTTL